MIWPYNLKSLQGANRYSALPAVTQHSVKCLSVTCQEALQRQARRTSRNLMLLRALRGCRPLLPHGNLCWFFLPCCCRAKLQTFTPVLAMAPWPREPSRSENESFQSEGWYYVSFAGLYHNYRKVIHAESSYTSKQPQIKHFFLKSPPSLSRHAVLD